MNENKTYVERVLWETIRKDCKYPIEDDNIIENNFEVVFD